MNVQRLLYTFVACLWLAPLSATVKLPEILSDHLVLQQQSMVKLWGQATAGSTVTIHTSWDDKDHTCRADQDGRWLTQVYTPQASYATHNIRFSDGQGEATTLKDILIGEVWFCSGQSNMQMPLNGYRNCPVDNSNELIALSGQYKGVRVATIQLTGAETPQEEVKGIWRTSCPKNASNFSATAYTYAMMVNRVLDVPVGIISCAWGGSHVEGWLPREIVATYPDIDLEKRLIRNDDGGWNWMSVIVMYNGMLHPLRNYTIKGFLWYQGESNVGADTTYAARLKTMVDLWRKEWGQGDIPFYQVEIAPFEYESYRDAARLRTAQHEAAKIIPNCDIVCANDLVYPHEQHQVHPARKQEVGNRLAYMALAKTYGVEGIATTYPEYKSLEIQGDKAIVSFTSWGCVSPFTGITGFEIAGADRKFYPATAKNVQYSAVLEISSPQVPQPVAVRYCYKNWQLGNVVSQRGLPLVPFRTDKW